MSNIIMGGYMVSAECGMGWKVGMGSNPFNFAQDEREDFCGREDTEKELGFIEEDRGVKIDLNYVLASFSDNILGDKVTNVGCRVGKGNPDRYLPYKERRECIRIRTNKVKERKKNNIKLCANSKCKQQFQGYNSAKYCSDDCRMYCGLKPIDKTRKQVWKRIDSVKVVVKCALPVCNNTFKTVKDGKYCSRQCSFNALRLSFVKENELIKCTYHKCNKLFKKHKTVVGSDGLIYCSPACCNHW